MVATMAAKQEVTRPRLAVRGILEQEGESLCMTDMGAGKQEVKSWRLID